MQFLWDEEKTRKLFRSHLILFFVGGAVASIYTIFLPKNTPYYSLIVAIPVIFTASCPLYFLFLNRPNPGIRFLLFNLEAQLAASLFMALTGGFLGIVQFAPYMFLLFSVFQLGASATVILGIFAILTFIGVFLWSAVFQPTSNLLQEFLYYTISYGLIVLVERNIGNEISLQFEAKKRLEHVDDLKNQFITITSHYLRTPLAVIKGFVADLKTNPLPESEKKDVDAIELNTKRLEYLIEKFLTISLIEKGKIKLLKETADIDGLISSVIEEFQPFTKEKAITLSYKGIPGLQASVDQSRLKEILASLLDNAIKFNSQNGQVTVSLVKNDTTIQIIVSDTGQGIPKDRLETLFSMFNRGGMDKTLQFDKEGMGINLYLSKLIIEAHNGTIAVASEEGKGTMFTITIPLV